MSYFDVDPSKECSPAPMGVGYWFVWYRGGGLHARVKAQFWYEARCLGAIKLQRCEMGLCAVRVPDKA